MSSENSNTNLDTRVQKAKRFRVQRLIKLGEWVESRQSILRLVAHTLWENFDKYMEDDDAYCEYMSNQMEAVDILNDLQIELRNVVSDDMPDFNEFNGKVVMTHRYACKDHRTDVFLEDFPHEQQQDTPKKATKKETVKNET
tara:strand:+ start:39 stop:464 length:426 start_codon:yes stop_codon:yes gene_type:complete